MPVYSPANRNPAPSPVVGITVFVLFAFFICGCALQPVDEGLEDPGPSDRGGEVNSSVAVIMGEDYSLPNWVVPDTYSGYVATREIARPSGSPTIENWWVSWADLEPEPGVYNWELVENKLAAAEAGGFQWNLHLQSLTWGGGNENLGIHLDRKVPEWVLDEYQLTDDDLINLGWEFDLLIIPGWKTEIRHAFQDLILAFGERGYPQHSSIASAYIHGISPSRGEEFWMTQEALARLEQTHGLTPQILEDWLTSRQDAYAEAFSGCTHKLVWVGKLGSWRYLNPDSYSDVARNLLQHAWALGAGNRSSIIERYNDWLEEPALGCRIDDDGYLYVDETIPPLESVRYYGDENEEYGDHWIWRYGSRAGDSQRYRFSLFRALQLQMRFLWTNPDAELINPPLSVYTANCLGKTVYNSPDAWAYLRESPINVGDTTSPVARNFERWLIQRDIPGGVTIPTQRVGREFDAGSNYQGGPDTWYDYVARRTDLATGNRAIYFDLDDRFRISGAAEIKVEILDDSQTSWYLEFTSVQHEVVRSVPFVNRNDGKVKTVTFSLQGVQFSNSFDQGMDFRIVCDGPGDLTARWVRVVRPLEP